MKETKVGCASWLDKSLVTEGNFYPRKSMTARERLAWYARFFSFVEVNSSFYAIPAGDVTQNWVERTPGNFSFGVKAWAPMTGHHVLAMATPPELRRDFLNVPLNDRREIAFKDFPKRALDASFSVFRRALEPLAKARKLDYVLFQFAPWVGATREWINYLASLPERLPGLPIAVEFRNPSWIPDKTERTLKFLRAHGLIHVAVDAPWMPLVGEASGSLFILRCHGRNVAGWRAQMEGKRPTVAEKYDYRYSPEEIEKIVERLEAIQEARLKILVFNNNNKDYPVQNALDAKKKLGQPAAEVEAEKREWKPGPPAWAESGRQKVIIT